MAIKSRRMTIIIVFVMISGLFVGVITFNSLPREKDEKFVKLQPLEAPKASSEESLVDKVFTFLTPHDVIQFSNLYLLEDINYYVLLEIVTFLFSSLQK